MSAPEDRGRGRGRISHGGRKRESSPSQRSFQKPSDRARSTDWARRVAFDVMQAVSEGAYANIELPQQLRRRRLGGRDAAFATELVYGTCRWRGLYDAILQRCFDRGIEDIDEPVLNVLRLGAHQVLGMRVPVHAAVSQSVGLARSVVGAGAGGFVNAILRKLTEKEREVWVSEVAETIADPIERLASVHSHPEWIVRALRAALLTHEASTPETVDEDLTRLLENHNGAPRVALVARPGLCEVADLVAEGATASTLSPIGAVLEEGGDPGSIAEVRSAAAAVQDEGSQLIALATVAAPITTRTDGPAKWLDVCAGPGGKVGVLAGASLATGAEVYANEVSEHRTDLVHQSVRAAVAQGASVMVGCGDGRTIGTEEPATYDRVLVDAPCSGLGSLRRRPEARWRKQPTDVGGLADLQRELLTSALEAVKPGGVVVYATCTPHPAETTIVVGDVLKGRTDVELLNAQELFLNAEGQPIPQVGPKPFVQMWPHLHGTDAMFCAVIRRQPGETESSAERS